MTIARTHGDAPYYAETGPGVPPVWSHEITGYHPSRAPHPQPPVPRRPGPARLGRVRAAPRRARRPGRRAPDPGRHPQAEDDLRAGARAPEAIDPDPRDGGRPGRALPRARPLHAAPHPPRGPRDPADERPHDQYRGARALQPARGRVPHRRRGRAVWMLESDLSGAQSTRRARGRTRPGDPGAERRRRASGRSVGGVQSAPMATLARVLLVTTLLAGCATRRPAEKRTARRPAPPAAPLTPPGPPSSLLA